MSGMITPDGTCTVCGKANVAPNHPFELPQSVTAPTDAVAQARAKYDRAVASLDAIRGIEFDVADEEKAVEEAWAEVIAAVRAECAADTKRLDWLDANKPTAALLFDGETTDVQLQTKDDEYEGATFRAAIDHAMQEAHP